MKVLEKKYLAPFILITSLFFLWGLANNMTDTLLAAFKRIMSMSDTQTSFIQMSFYGAYFCVAFPAALFIRKRSYKSGVILGLSLYALGAMLFFPAAKVASYGFYLVAIYVLACGCSVLETTANPYILSMGDPETATRRLNVAQAFNPLGSITGILLSQAFILSDISLYSVSGTYFGLGCVLVILMVVMLCVKMPEGKDDSSTADQNSWKNSIRRLISNKKYLFGVVAQFFYVGAQIGVWSFTIRIVMNELGILEKPAATIYLISIIGFCVSRFVYTWLMKYFKPSKLLIYGALLSLLCTLVVVFTSGTQWLMVIALMLVSVFMSLMFPTIYGIALGDVEKESCGGYAGDAKIGASGLIMAILGGAVLTPIQGLVSDAAGINWSYSVPAFCFTIVLLYALYVTRMENAN